MKEISILLVEDNILNQKLIFLTLKKYGFVIDTANNGFVAVEKAKIKKYSIILMDIMMPIMDGIEATKAIRKIEEESNEHIPIVGLTANTYDADKEKCIAAGMDDFMTKPFDFVVFKKVLKDLGFDFEE